jgi:Mn-dependent DtxR family transcriptional regulator
MRGPRCSNFPSVRNTHVTEAARALQRRGLIEYARGYVKIVNRKALENSSCECYALIREYNGEMIR